MLNQIRIAKGKALLALAVAGALAASPVWAKEKSSKHEAAGLGAGAAIGAAAGGPVGFILGAAFGGWLGDRFHHEKEMRVAAEQSAAQSRDRAAELEGRLDGSRRDLAKLEATLAAERQANRTALGEALDVSVYFRTGKSELDTESAERLTRIAELLAPMDGVVVELEGYADKRGDELYNEQLSAARAEAVRQAFVGAGFPEDRISVAAEGERYSIADEHDFDGLALERRVAIAIDNGAAEQRVAQQQ
ncbi:MAG TPA: OmpA family protein [Gammaproteobacteria bacterium]|nr:OmpA family protein [Gammaproteobacteria bacterium]